MTKNAIIEETFGMMLPSRVNVRIKFSKDLLKRVGLTRKFFIDWAKEKRLEIEREINPNKIAEHYAKALQEEFDTVMVPDDLLIKIDRSHIGALDDLL